MTQFKIETKHRATGAWENVHTVKPDYQVNVARVWKWWIWPIEIGVIPNLRQAEQLARKQAIKCAKRLRYKAQVRVVKASTENGAKTTDVIWQNGKVVQK
ncbi:MAG: hypothetical protein DWQ31_16840 [Planctomycetota bacterium]|nr:MAG: hypothetical protein DWQ31_16840 [Planctomycetota bacterium]REJ92021.1 MAG: hypothetical protein DWQ35_12790 [Planctomycetota bacterium]REK28557.1 MAG: hypothetical protein DWQ42_04380 [Planctomycetota bacterium]REK39172.1 MAG: hypothetical protein DWQ46_17965 [Planctomycetota bacterium]